MNRKSIATNIARKLWAQCGGFCQNPSCNKYLFANVADEELISSTVESIHEVFEERSSQLDITICSEAEYKTISFEDDNRIRIR